MPFIIVALFSGAVGLLRGGRLSNLTRLTIRWSALALIALGIQMWVLYGPGRDDAGPFSFSALLILASYAVLLVAVVANRHLPGMSLLGLGAALNFVVILANGGWMPVTAEDLAAAGLLSTPTALHPGQRARFSKDVVMLNEDMRLGWLTDVLMVPNVGFFSAVFSVGDVLMMLGLFRLIQVGLKGQNPVASQAIDAMSGSD